MQVSKSFCYAKYKGSQMLILLPKNKTPLKRGEAKKTKLLSIEEAANPTQIATKFNNFSHSNYV